MQNAALAIRTGIPEVSPRILPACLSRIREPHTTFFFFLKDRLTLVAGSERGS